MAPRSTMPGSLWAAGYRLAAQGLVSSYERKEHRLKHYGPPPSEGLPCCCGCPVCRPASKFGSKDVDGMKSIKVPGPRPKSRLRRGTLPSRPGGVSADAGPAGGGRPPAVHGGAASGSPPRLGFAPQQDPGDPRLLAEYIVGRLPGKWPRRPAPCCSASARYVACSRRTWPTWPRSAASAGRPPRPSALPSTHPIRTPREWVAQHRYPGRLFPLGS